ncbi:hypothetical protein [Roseibium sp. RKSG952]|nr:hypothetical protein [Roseibium sp. RKSG952]
MRQNQGRDHVELTVFAPELLAQFDRQLTLVALTQVQLKIF